MLPKKQRPIGRLRTKTVLNDQIERIWLSGHFAAQNTLSPPDLLQAKGRVVGRGGLEPPTSRLSGVRSNHLSYRPRDFLLRKKLVVRQAICVSKSAESSTQWLCHLTAARATSGYGCCRKF